MGRKPIPVSQRAVPIAFSLKPHLVEKIDDYANDLRFSRSKFLQEAVTQYILKTDMGYMASSNNVNDMTLAQKVAVGLAALQEANREGETISKPVMDALRRELNMLEEEATTEKSRWEATKKKWREINTPAPITFKRIESGLYHIYNSGMKVGHIKRDTNFKRKWIVVDADGSSSHFTLQDAKDAFLEVWG